MHMDSPCTQENGSEQNLFLQRRRNTAKNLRDFALRLKEIGKGFAREGWIGKSLQAFQKCYDCAILSQQDGIVHREDTEEILSVMTESATSIPLQRNSRRPHPHPYPLRVAHISGILSDTHSPTKYIRALLPYLDQHHIRPYLYSTEWKANQGETSRFRANETLRECDELGIPIFFAVTSGNWEERAVRFAERLIQDEIDIALFHAGRCEVLTTFIALLRPAPIMVNVSHGDYINSPIFHAFLFLWEANYTSLPVPPTSRKELIDFCPNIFDALEKSTPLSRKELAIPENAVISATFGGFHKISNPHYLETLSRLLRAHGNLHHIIAGWGGETYIRNYLTCAGVMERVKILGTRNDIPSLLKSIDLYLNSFPDHGGASLIEAMAAGVACVGMKSDPLSHWNSGAAAIGMEECLAGKEDYDRYNEIASGFIINPSYRIHVGHELKKRSEEKFHPRQASAKHEHFYRELYETVFGPDVQGSTTSNP